LIDTELDDLERLNSPYLCFFSPHFIDLLTNYITVVKDRLVGPLMHVNIVSQFQCSSFGHNYPTLQHGLSAIAELLVLLLFQFYCSCAGRYSRLTQDVQVKL